MSKLNGSNTMLLGACHLCMLCPSFSPRDPPRPSKPPRVIPGLGVDSVMRVTCMLLPGSLLPLVTCRKRKTLHFTSIWSQSKIF
ncbi:unnamed protein product [Ixodes pacificus]